ncbi:DcuS/MalK family sensor histidine kinase [Azotosporobacter soli]|uniref:DcuS/MalK family sensor histidine kinase n=1 Tax=Azotosporobacter soli TaxID=3055040 RepID=UPI0031FF2056
MKKSLDLQSKIILLGCSVVAIALLVCNLLVSQLVADEKENDLWRQTVSVARMVAKAPVVVQSLSHSDDDGEIQAYASQSMVDTNVQFITVFDMEGKRRSHPNPELIGQRIAGGDEKESLLGKEYRSIAQGTLGYSLRAFTPVIDAEGRQIGVVLVGLLMDDVKVATRRMQVLLLVASLLGLAVGITGAVMLARNIKKTLFGLEPEEIASMLEERNGILQSVREGIIAIGSDGRITLINEEAKRLLSLYGVAGEPVGQPVNRFVPNSRLLEVVRTGMTELNQEQDFCGVSVLTNRVPLLVEGKIVGAIASFKDKTEINQLAEELTGVREYMEALRSQSHEFMNQFHVVLGLVRLESYELLADYVNKVVKEHRTEVDFVRRRIKDTVMAGFILSKLSAAREKDVVMRLAEESWLPKLKPDTVVHELVTIIGNLLENAFDAVKDAAEKEVELSIRLVEDGLSILVRDTGTGIPFELGAAIFQRGVSGKGPERGIGLYLVKRSLERLHGVLDYDSAPEDGTEFRIIIPYEDAPGISGPESKGEVND